EAAVMAGLQVSRAICGRPHDVFGETDACEGWWGMRMVTAVVEKLTATFTTAEPAAPGPPMYVDRGGEQVYSHPVSLQGVRFYSFLLKADRAALTELCERYLNRPAQGKVRYHPLLPRILLGLGDIQRAQPTDEPGSRVGWLAERDVAFWVPVVA